MLPAELGKHRYPRLMLRQACPLVPGTGSGRSSGTTLAAGSSDGTVLLWDVASGTQVGEPLAGHQGSVLSVAFSPDGKTLASGSSDQTVILWDLDPASLMAQACRLAGRNLSRAEWQRYLGDLPYQQTCPEYPVGD